MAATSYILMSAGLTGDISGKSVLSERRSFNAQFQVKAAQGDTAQTIIEYFRTTAGLPYLGDGYAFGNDSEATAICTKLSPRLVEQSGGIWIVTASYEPEEGKEDPEEKEDKNGNKSDNPLEWHEDIATSYSRISIPAEAAIFRGAVINGVRGQAIPPMLNIGDQVLPCNSAFVPFDPTLEREIPIKIITFTKNVAAHDGPLNNSFIGVVNSDQVNINKPDYTFTDVWQPLTARIQNINCSFQIANKIRYWKEAVEVHINPLTWRKFVCDRGMQMLLSIGTIRPDGSTVSGGDSDRDTFAALTDRRGFPISSPVLFNGKGAPLNPLTEKPVYLEYQLDPEIAFAAINW